MWRNNIKCKYMFTFPHKNLARKKVHRFLHENRHIVHVVHVVGGLFGSLSYIHFQILRVRRQPIGQTNAKLLHTGHSGNYWYFLNDRKIIFFLKNTFINWLTDQCRTTYSPPFSILIYPTLDLHTSYTGDIRTLNIQPACMEVIVSFIVFWFTITHSIWSSASLIKVCRPTVQHSFMSDRLIYDHLAWIQVQSFL